MNTLDELKQVIEELESHVSKRKGCRSVTFNHLVFSSMLEELIKIHEKLGKEKL